MATNSNSGNSVIPDDIRESIAIGALTTIASQPSTLSNLTYANMIGNVNLSQQNTVANQQAVNQLSLAVIGNAVNLVADLSPMEATAVVKMDTGNDVAEQLSALKAATAGLGPNPIYPPVPPTPPKPPKPPTPPTPPVTPSVGPNPTGGTLVMLRKRDLPASIDVIDAPKVSVQNVSGLDQP